MAANYAKWLPLQQIKGVISLLHYKHTLQQSLTIILANRFILYIFRMKKQTFYRFKNGQHINKWPPKSWFVVNVHILVFPKICKELFVSGIEIIF